MKWEGGRGREIIDVFASLALISFLVVWLDRVETPSCLRVEWEWPYYGSFVFARSEKRGLARPSKR